MKMTQQDLADLLYARKLLSSPGYAAKLTDLLATPIEKGFDLLPQKWANLVHLATSKSLEKALTFAVVTTSRTKQFKHSEMIHKIAVATSGATGGAFGLTSLVIELPISTIIMLRSIADIAKSEGEDLNSLETKLNCLEVFALGGQSSKDNAVETGYWAIRATLTKAVSDAAKFIAERGLSERGAPVLVRLITMIASRFGIVVSEKAAAMAIPAIGAIGGAVINAIFIEHFQKLARAHFTIRRLERKYSMEYIQFVMKN